MPLDATERIINEKTTFTYTCYLVNEADQVIPLANISTLTLTLYNKADSSIVNSRNAQNVLNANNVTVHATSGLVTWSVQVEDTTLVSTSLAPGELEEHRFMFTWTHSGGTNRDEDYFLVKNLLKVT